VRRYGPPGEVHWRVAERAPMFPDPHSAPTRLATLLLHGHRVATPA
jgi:hypothetical protein